MEKIPKIIHVIDSFCHNGAELSVLTLVQEGFYAGCDLRVIGLNQGPLYKNFVDALGSDKVRALLPAEKLESRRDYFTLFRKLSHEFESFRPDTAVLSLVVSNVLGQSAALFFPRTKIISFMHGDKRNWDKAEWMLDRLAFRVDAMASDSRGVLRAWPRYSHLKTCEVPAITLQGSAPRRSKPPPQRFQLLSLGRLTEVKNYAELIRAVGLLARRGHDLDLTILGEGSLQKSLRELADVQGVSGRVHMPGYVSDPRAKQEFMNRADIYVQPSLSEGLCRATVEALAAGVPMVVTKFAGVEDYGQPGKNMIVADGCSAEALAKSLAYLIRNYAELAAAMSPAEVETAKRIFGSETVFAKRQAAAPIFRTPRALRPSSRPSSQSDAESRARLSPQLQR